MEEFNSRAALLEAVRDVRAALAAVIVEAGEERAVQQGSFEALSLKDLIAHLTGWRSVTAVRLEAALRDEEPGYPWPDGLDEAEDLDTINRWFYETNLDKPLDQILAESAATFERLEQLITALPDEALFEPGRFDWLSWTDEALGPAVVGGMYHHYHLVHAPEIKAWLRGAD